MKSARLPAKATLPGSLALAWALAVGVLALPDASNAATDVVPRAAAAGSSGVIGLGSSPEWHELTPAEKKALMPLAQSWPTMDSASRDKWVNVADRFGKLSPPEQQRVQDRMAQWAKLPPQVRGDARLRFQQSRQLSANERQRKWAAYQALSPQERLDLAQQAQRKSKPVFLADNVPGPREARQAYATKHYGGQNGSSRKSNVVPNTMAGVATAPMAVTPTMVRAGPGATTTLVSQRPTPPLHQHTGLPKIAAGKGFVDPVTLLPRKGAQSAAMASLPSAAAHDNNGDAPHAHR